MRKNKRTQLCLDTSLNSITCSGSLGMISAFYSTPFCWCKDIKFRIKSEKIVTFNILKSNSKSGYPLIQNNIILLQKVLVWQKI